MGNSYFCVTHKNQASRVCINFVQFTQKILTKGMITETLRFLQILNVRKTTTQLFNISEAMPEYQQKNSISDIFWAITDNSCGYLHYTVSS